MPKEPILRLDIQGNPMAWLSDEEASYYYAKDLVAWTYGDPIRVLRGGYGRDGTQTEMPLHPVFANKGSIWRNMPEPPLTNDALFQRDEYTCLYCGGVFSRKHLTRDHIHPRSRGGADTWMNTVCSCVRCNSHKSNRTLQQAGMSLLAVPYVPNQAEFLFLLRHRRILGSQMDILRSRFKSQRLLEQTRNWEPVAA
ncbi:HNH endonuclease [Acidithiobacillus sp. M4-SHS-6]|uniref:HNH endonuclease n=1 Tax=Acidithiobacillus sp. M4-SHS-6 TaxID=3383024 RepID=UPI0039BE5DF7